MTWSEAKIKRRWRAILGLTLPAATAGFPKSGDKAVYSSGASLGGVQKSFGDDKKYRLRLFHYLWPLIFAVEKINQDPRNKLEEGDPPFIIDLFSSATLVIDHLAFVVGCGRLSEVAALFRDCGFEVTDEVLPSPQFPASGIMLARNGTCTGGRNLYVAVLEGVNWYEENGTNVFLSHALTFGERTPFSMTLDIHRLVPRENRLLYRDPYGREPELWEPEPVEQKLLKHFQKYEVLPLEPEKVSIAFPKRNPEMICARFSTLPLCYGLRIVFLRRFKVKQGVDPYTGVPLGEVEEEGQRGYFPIE